MTAPFLVTLNRMPLHVDGMEKSEELKHGVIQPSNRITLVELFELEKEILRKEYELKIKELNDKMLMGQVGDADWLREQLGISDFKIIKSRLLYPFRDELEGDIVYYSDEKGVPWRINKTKFNEWLVENFKRVNWSDKT